MIACESLLETRKHMWYFVCEENCTFVCVCERDCVCIHDEEIICLYVRNNVCKCVIHKEKMSNTILNQNFEIN